MKKVLTVIGAIATLFVIPYIVGVLNSATDNYLSNHGITYNRILVLLIIIVFVSVFFVLVSYLCFVFIAKKLNISNVQRVLALYQYNGSALFNISQEEIIQYSMLTSVRNKRLYLKMLQQFNLFPVIYYNVTAKNFLNWIDFLYLDILKNLNEKCNAKIIISLHVDESLLASGVYDENAKEKYLELKKSATEIIKKVIPNAQIKDEYTYYLKTKNSMNNHPEYFIGTIISNINYYVHQIYSSRIDYDKFIRKESNILSVMPISLLSHKYRHLFVLDYVGSFDIWEMQPYKELKKRNNIFFITCNSIVDKNGNRIPSWNKSDGVNLTDTAEEISNKIRNNDRKINIALYEIYKGISASGLNDIDLQDQCIAIILDIKAKYNL